MPPQGGRKHPHQEFIQIDTRNILFICGGTFDGIEDVIAKRVGVKGSLGFGASSRRNSTNKTDLLRQITPEDLMAFGMIPEIVGRLPVAVNVDPLDKAALMRILVEPKNALVKQFQRLMSLDGVELVFTDEALSSAADQALKRNTGARGLRTIIETSLLDVMYEVPSHREIKKVIVDREAIERVRRPQIVGENGQLLTWHDDTPLESAA